MKISNRQTRKSVPLLTEELTIINIFKEKNVFSKIHKWDLYYQEHGFVEDWELVSGYNTSVHALFLTPSYVPLYSVSLSVSISCVSAKTHTHTQTRFCIDLKRLFHKYNYKNLKNCMDVFYIKYMENSHYSTICALKFINNNFILSESCLDFVYQYLTAYISLSVQLYLSFRNWSV